MAGGQSAAPLPAVVYPTRDPDTRPPAGGLPGMAPRPVWGLNQGQPVQSYLVDGIWGYRDHDRRFHPAPADWRPPEHGLAVGHAHAGPRLATLLPNPAPRRIVTNQIMPLNRGRPR